MKYIVNLEDVNSSHIGIVGGKNASTGEMLQHLLPKGINIPSGFATTIEAYKKFIAQNGLDKKITQTLSAINTTNINALNKAGQQIRRWIIATPFSKEFISEITEAYAKLGNQTVAVLTSSVC